MKYHPLISGLLAIGLGMNAPREWVEKMPLWAIIAWALVAGAIVNLVTTWALRPRK